MTSTEAAQREATEDKLDPAQEQLLRQVALKMLATVEEEERARRINEETQENALKSAAYDKLISVQEDLVRTINLLKVTIGYNKCCMSKHFLYNYRLAVSLLWFIFVSFRDTESLKMKN